jgi:hypothetical protein
MKALSLSDLFILGHFSNTIMIYYLVVIIDVKQIFQ